VVAVQHYCVKKQKNEMREIKLWQAKKRELTKMRETRDAHDLAGLLMPISNGCFSRIVV